VPFDECSEEELIVLADHSWLDSAGSGHVLARAGETDNWDYYLIEGTLRLVAEDGKEIFLMGGSRTARSPVAHLQPRQYTLSALTPIKYLRVDTGLLKNLSFSGLAESVYVEKEFEVGDLDENPLYAEIHADLVTDRLVIPSMPEVAIKIRRMVEEEAAPLQAVAKLINADPAISAKIVKSANGSLYHGQPPVANSVQAIARLGLNTTKHLVVSFVLRNLFQEKITTELLNHCVRDLWSHSVEVAAISMALANVTPGLDSEEALLVGLLHDIGELVILSYADNYPEISADPVALKNVIMQLKAAIGGAVLRQWQFADAFVTAASNAEDWMRDSEAGPDYCDLVTVAHLHSYFGTAKMDGLPNLAEVPAFGKLAGGELTPEVSMLVLDEAKERIHETRQLLLS
jgi:HD-like signal output (HDOD) protein